MTNKVYTKNNWTDEVLTGDARYDINQNDGTLINEEVEIALRTEVSVAGTAMTAERMNNIENGIDALDDLLAALQNTFQFDEATEITVSSGTLTLTQSVNKILPESGTEDEINTLDGMTAGKINIVYASNSAHTLTFKHRIDNISCTGGVDIALSEGVIFVYFDGAVYYILGTGGGSCEVSDDTSPQLSGDLDMQQNSLLLPSGEPTSDLTGVGTKDTVTVDTNSLGIGAILFLNTDGNYDEADADGIATMSIPVIALEAGTGSKKILRSGKFRNDSWDWTPGSILYVSLTQGTLVDDVSTYGEDEVVWPVGQAETDHYIWFNPAPIYLTHAAQST